MYKDITMSYFRHLDGGGTAFGQEFIKIIKEKIGPVEHIFEYCAGCGFIGFSLLANGLCKRLTLADINPEAIRCCNETVMENNLESKVSVYLSDCLDDIPTTERWDLVVGNPPHWPNKYYEDIRKFDPGLAIHKKFYSGIHKFLKPGGNVLFQENCDATSISDFLRMIEDNNLKIIDVFKSRPISIFEFILESMNMLILSKLNLIDYAIRIRYLVTRFKESHFYFIWTKQK